LASLFAILAYILVYLIIFSYLNDTFLANMVASIVAIAIITASFIMLFCHYYHRELGIRGAIKNKIEGTKEEEPRK
jgi:hypothetical protein